MMSFFFRLILGFFGMIAFLQSLPPVWPATEGPPRRVVCQVPSITETLFALGLGDYVVGVSRYCRFPPEAQTKEKIGGLYDASTEKILALKPDLVIVAHGQDELASFLRSNNISVYSSTLEKIADVYRIIRDLGERFEVPDRASDLVASIEKDLSDIRKALSDLPEKKVLFVVGREPGSLKSVYGVGPDTFLDEMLSLVRARNVLADRSMGRYPQLSLETLVRLDPERILDGGATREEAETGKMPVEWKALAAVTAVREIGVIPVHDSHLTIPGPSIPANAKKIAVLIHGESAAKRLAGLSGP